MRTLVGRFPHKRLTRSDERSKTSRQAYDSSKDFPKGIKPTEVMFMPVLISLIGSIDFC